MRKWIFGLLMLMGGLSAAAAERRVALIIGNDAYVKIGALQNAANDARKMDQALRAAGFETTIKIDAKRRTLYSAIDAFAAQIAATPETVGLFYYAGHGIQANGNNYLIPIDADIDSEADLEAEAVDAGKVLRAMGEAHNRLNIVVLDACRDNPLPKKSRSASRGLARMDAPSGTFIAYAAGPGQTAQDGSAGGNGVFTGELVKAIALPGLPIEQVFKKAAAGVRAQTGEKQVPWTEASLQGDFYFHVAGAAAAPTPAAAPALAGTDPGAFELAYWNSVKDSKNPAEIKAYLDSYPKGNFAGIAKVRYDDLRAAAAPANAPPSRLAMTNTPAQPTVTTQPAARAQPTVTTQPAARAQPAASGQAIGGGCVYPRAPGASPDGHTATRDQMIAAKHGFDRYNGDMNAYLDCIKLESDSAVPKDPSTLTPDEKRKADEQRKMLVQKHNAAVDELQTVVGRFNDQLMIFQARQ